MTRPDHIPPSNLLTSLFVIIINRHFSSFSISDVWRRAWAIQRIAIIRRTAETWRKLNASRGRRSRKKIIVFVSSWISNWPGASKVAEHKYEHNGITFTKRCPKGIVLCVVSGRRRSTWSARATHSTIGHPVSGGAITRTWTDQSDVAGVTQRHENHSGKLPHLRYTSILWHATHLTLKFSAQTRLRHKTNFYRPFHFAVVVRGSLCLITTQNWNKDKNPRRRLQCVRVVAMEIDVDLERISMQDTMGKYRKWQARHFHLGAICIGGAAGPSTLSVRHTKRSHDSWACLCAIDMYVQTSKPKQKPHSWALINFERRRKSQKKNVALVAVAAVNDALCSLRFHFESIFYLIPIFWPFFGSPSPSPLF